MNRGATSNHLRPERHIRAADIAPQHIEALMPIVQFLIVAAFEARAPKLKHLQVVAERCPDNGRRHMSRIGDAIGGRELAAQGRCAVQRPHDPASSLGVKLLTTALTPVLRGARNFDRRVAGSLGDALRKLNRTNCRVRANRNYLTRLGTSRPLFSPDGEVKSRA